MLKPECERFQRYYERGRRGPHADRCDDCRRFAEFVDGLAELGLSDPLAERLRARLRRLPLEEAGIPVPPQVPQLPLPAGLDRRLRRIARPAARETLPIWIRSPRYAVAASYVLTLLIAGTLGNPAAWAGEAGQRLDRFESTWQSVRQAGRARWTETWSGVEGRIDENVSTTQDFLRASKSSLRARWLELVESLREEDTHRDTRDGADATSGAGASI